MIIVHLDNNNLLFLNYAFKSLSYFYSILLRLTDSVVWSGPKSFLLFLIRRCLSRLPMWAVSLCEDKFLSAKRGRTFVCPRALDLLVCIIFRCRELAFCMLSCCIWFIGEKAGTYERELPWAPPAPTEIRCRDLDRNYLPEDQLDDGLARLGRFL